MKSVNGPTRKSFEQIRFQSPIVRPSAFKATSTQFVDSEKLAKVYFPTTLFDLAHEYNPKTSTFIPKKDGVYAVTASVNYVSVPPRTTTPSDTIIFITVNNKQQDLEDDFIINPANSSMSQVSQINDILNLNAGDRVEVFFAPLTSTGTILGNVGTFFASARFPSPTCNKKSTVKQQQFNSERLKNRVKLIL